MEYVVDPGASNEALRSGLRKRLRLRAESRGRKLRFYDTFDWRLFARGWTLEIEELESGDYRAICRARHNTRVLSQPLDGIPGRLADWPDGPVRDLLFETAGLRELVPIVVLEGSREHFSVANDDDKVVSRLCLEDWRVRRGSRRLSDAPKNRIRITPLKGWERETEEAAASVVAPGVRPASRSLLESALLRTGRKPLDYSSKLDIKLSPDVDAARALRTILLHLGEAMRTNEPGIRRAVDTECLHDFRVAIRRTRSALAQLKGVFDPQAVAWYREEFAWLGSATGRKRDLDVHLLELDSQKALLPHHLRDDLEPLRGFLEAKQATEGEELNRVLAGERYRRLMRKWRRFLTANDRSVEGVAAARPAKDVADERIWKLFRKVVKQGKAIDDQSPPEKLHELRKTCKKLRYLMESFRSLYAEKKIRKTIRQLKRLQDNLGDFQDQTVQMVALREHAAEMSRESAEPGTMLAIGALIERIADQHTQTRAEFTAIFQRFARRKNAELFAGLFKPAVPERRSVEDRRVV